MSDDIGPNGIAALIDKEVESYDANAPIRTATLAAFQAARTTPRLVTVNFSGGLRQRCYAVTQSDGDYRVIYLPRAGYFSLCVESAFGPLDIGVHGGAIDCFGSV